jgi:hypothetical protein
MRILVGCEESQEVCKAFRALGHEAYSCDLKDCSGGHPEWHIKGDVFAAIKLMSWDMGIFFPDCTYLTCSAEWAYGDGPYHQKVKPGTLVGEARRIARLKAIKFFTELYNCGIPRIVMENPVGVMNSLRHPDQIIHPYMFGDDASKSTCLWLYGVSKLRIDPLKFHPHREVIVNGKKYKRWGNQTDSGQNRLTPGEKRAELRSKTYPGIAKAMAEQWGNINTEQLSA